MPTPKRRGGGGGDCGTDECCGSIGTSEQEWTKRGRSREGPPPGSDREEACDKRSRPQDVTSSWVRRGGVNLRQEVEPHQTERPPRDSPNEDTPERRPG